MKCRECQRDMSQCLDGRLPSGRRSAVMQHLETCEECNQLWGEFQRAQELVLRLPVRTVSPDFHQRLWERIKAGEGSPEAVFSEPMPLLTKARYVFVGAAAAALVLIMLNGWSPGTVQDSFEPGREIVTTLTPASEPMPLVPASFAGEAAKVVARDYRTLDENFRKLQTLPQGQLDESTFAIICDSAGAVKAVGRILLEMHRSEHLELPREMEVKLRIAESSLDVNKLKLMRDPQELRDTLSPVIRQLQSLELLPRQIMVRVDYGSEEQQDFEQKIGELLWQDREILDYVHIQFPEQSGMPAWNFMLKFTDQNSGARSGVRGRFRFERANRVYLVPTPRTGK